MGWLDKKVRKGAAKFDKKVGLTDTGDHAQRTAQGVVTVIKVVNGGTP